MRYRIGLLAVVSVLVNGAAQTQGRLGHLECLQPDQGGRRCPEFGYRSGKCQDCDCCPTCWNCAELLHYQCPKNNGLELEILKVHRTLAVGGFLDWPIAFLFPPGSAAFAASLPPFPNEGWLQCASLPSLPLGLVFSDQGRLHGSVLFDSRQPKNQEFERTFTAFNLRGWSSTNRTVFKLELLLTVANLQPKDKSVQEQTDSSAAWESYAAARRAEAEGRAAFTLYEVYAQGRQGHFQTVAGMSTHLKLLHESLLRSPLMRDGLYWAWLGAAHMTTHKLLENVLPECERFLGLALLFPSEETKVLAKQNLDGCLGKRRLEAAKSLFFEGMQLLLAGSWADAVATLTMAAAKKNGWGWAVNQGEIHSALASGRIIVWMEAIKSNQAITMNETSDDDSQSLVQDESKALEEARSAMDFASQRAPGHAWVALNRDLMARAQAAFVRSGADDFGREIRYAAARVGDLCGATLAETMPRERPELVLQSPWAADLEAGWGAAIPSSVSIDEI